MDTPPELTPADLTPLDPAYRTVLRIVASIWSAVFLVGALVRHSRPDPRHAADSAGAAAALVGAGLCAG